MDSPRRPPPEPGLTWLALESIFSQPTAPYPRCLWVDLAPRLRAAWKYVKEKADPADEVAQDYLAEAADAGKRKNWVECAGWTEAARRRIAGEECDGEPDVPRIGFYDSPTGDMPSRRG